MNRLRALGSQLSFKTIFVSDIHLGTRGCKAAFFLDFLKHTESEQLYLVGDIIDGWQLRRRWYWPQAHNDVVQKVLRHADPKDAFDTFNMGLGWVAIVAPGDVDKALACGENAKVIGTMDTSAQVSVEIV